MRIILKDGSGVVNLKFISDDVDRHGNVRIYFRRNGHKIRLREVAGTQLFLDEYRTAIEGTVGAKAAKLRIWPGTMNWLVGEYYRSAEYKRLDDATKAQRAPFLDSVCKTHGQNLCALMEPRHVRAIRDAMTETPHAADNLLKTLRGLFKWAIKHEHMKANPAREVEKINAPSEGHHVWTVGEILQFMEKHPADTKAGLALALLFYTGVRRSDVVKLGRQHETRDGCIRLVETKGRSRKVKVTELEICPELRAVLDLHKTEHLTYLVTAYGRPHGTKGFGNWFKKQATAAGIGHCTPHGLRKARATIAADNGASGHQLMAMFGWATPGQAEVYTRGANRKKLAAEGGRLVSLMDKK